jgi:hypothetical protein
MTLKEMLPELNHNQLKMLKHIIMDGLPKKMGNTATAYLRTWFEGYNQAVDDLTTALEKMFDE